MSGSSKYVMDKSKELMDSAEKLAEFRDLIKKDPLVGDIQWHRDQRSLSAKDKELGDLVEQIEKHLIDNNQKFARFPNDLRHGQMSYDVYRENIKEADQLMDTNEQTLVMQNIYLIN